LILAHQPEVRSKDDTYPQSLSFGKFSEHTHHTYHALHRLASLACDAIAKVSCAYACFFACVILR
jgi:hypothetical protein